MPDGSSGQSVSRNPSHSGQWAFGSDDDKQDFRVFDFCFNFDFFRENPEGINAGDSPPLGTRLFRARVQLLGHVQTSPELDPDAALRSSLADGLHGEVAAMNRENFIVRMHLDVVEHFEDRAAWDQLSENNRETLQRELAGLPSEIATDDIESRPFDLTALRMQLALVDRDQGAFEGHRKRVVEIAMQERDCEALRHRPARIRQEDLTIGKWLRAAELGPDKLHRRGRQIRQFLPRSTQRFQQVGATRFHTNSSAETMQTISPCGRRGSPARD